jgi:hypothetical protein
MNKEISQLNHTVDQMDLTDISRTFHQKNCRIHSIFTTHGTLHKIGHNLGHKASLNKYKNDRIFFHLIIP